MASSDFHVHIDTDVHDVLVKGHPIGSHDTVVFAIETTRRTHDPVRIELFLEGSTPHQIAVLEAISNEARRLSTELSERAAEAYAMRHAGDGQ